MEARRGHVCKEGQVYVRTTNDMRVHMWRRTILLGPNSVKILYCLFGNMVRINTYPVYKKSVYRRIDHYKGTVRIGGFMFLASQGKTKTESRHNVAFEAVIKLFLSDDYNYLRVVSKPWQVFIPRFKCTDWERYGIPSKIKEYIKASTLPILQEMPMRTIRLLFNDNDYNFKTYPVRAEVQFWEEAIYITELRLKGYGRFLSIGSTAENSQNDAIRLMLNILFPDYTYDNDIQIFQESPAFNLFPNRDESMKELILASVHAYKIGAATETLHSLFNYTEMYFYNEAVKSFTCEIVVAGKKFYGFGEGKKEARRLAARDALCQLFCHYPNNAPPITMDRKYC